MNTLSKDGSDGATTQDLSDFVGVMGQLKALIEVENYYLRRGMPATLLGSTASKEELSRRYRCLGETLAEGASGQILGDPELHAKLFEATADLCTLSVENRKLLSKALNTARRRVDSVMDAVRASCAAGDGQGDAEASPNDRQ